MTIQRARSLVILAWLAGFATRAVLLSRTVIGIGLDFRARVRLAFPEFILSKESQDQ